MRGLWIAIAVATALACGVLGYLLATRKPVHPGAVGLRNGAVDVENVIEAYLKVDPKLIIAKETGRLSTGFKELRGLAVGPEDRVYATGDKAYVVLSPDGKTLSKVDLDKQPTAVGVGPDATVYLSFMDHIEVYDAKGARTASWEKPGPKAWITSIAVTENEVYVADFGDKTVFRCDKAGKVVGRLGDVAPAAGTGLYEIPSPYFDVVVDGTGHPWVAHTGKLRIENYKDDGSMKMSWGLSGPQIERFSGCCNPSHFAMRKDGSFVTSEKGLVRVKIHSPTGELVGVVAPAKDFEKGIHGLDLAVDSKDRILVLDPATSTVRVYALKGAESNP